MFDSLQRFAARRLESRKQDRETRRRSGIRRRLAGSLERLEDRRLLCSDPMHGSYPDDFCDEGLQSWFSIDDVSVLEGDAGTSVAAFTVNRSGIISVAASVDYQTQDNTATAPDDYVASGPVTLLFGIGVTTQTVNVTVNSDTLDEGEHSFFVNLSNPSGALGAWIDDPQGIGTILDSDNEDPSISSIALTAAIEDSLYSYDVEANDPDVGDALTYSLVNAPDGMTIDPVSGLVQWTPVAADVGDHDVTVAVQDSATAEDSQSFTITVDAVSSGPNLAHGVVPSVTSVWQTVTLSDTYREMVVVATPRYNAGSGPGVVRIDNVTSNSFDIRVDNVGSSPFSGGAHYVVVEAGVYDEPGFKLEAVKYSETQTSRKNGWVIDTASQGYQQSYNSPVVVGQVMSANDEDFSVFWASSGRRTGAPTSSQLNVGKHIAEDPDTSRAAETIGYLVIESTQDGTIEGLSFVAGVGRDTVRGVGNGTYQYGYDAMANAKTAVLSSAGMDGGDGGWAVLRGSDPVSLTGGTIDLSIDEEQLKDSERKHTTEQVAYFVIHPPLEPGESIDLLSSVPPAIMVHNPWDVNGDGVTSPLDALLIINRLQNEAALEVGDLALDTNDDGSVSPLDALFVINRLSAVAQYPAPELGASNATDAVFSLEEEEQEDLFGIHYPRELQLLGNE